MSTMGSTPTTATNPVPAAPSNITTGPPSSTAPAPVQDFGGIAQVAPAYQTATGYTADTVNPYGATQAYDQYAQQLTQSLQPGFAQQQQQLQDSLAARGISNSGAAGYDTGNLEAQQGATVAGDLSNFTQQMYGYQQGDVAANQAATNAASQFGASATNTAAGANASTANAASAANAASYNADVNTNANDYNAYQAALLGYGQNDQNAMLSAYLNSFDPNSGVTSALGSATGQIGSTYGSVYQNAQTIAAQQNQQAAAAAAGG